MAADAARSPSDTLRQLTIPVAIAVACVVAAAWYVTWSTTDFFMALMSTPSFPAESLHLALFVALLVVMMVAMMLPAALPMILAYHGLTRLEGGQPVRPADATATAAFVAPYFLVWGAFAVVALLALMTLGLMGPMMGPLVLLPAAVLLSAGAYQFTRAKEVCLSHCQSPMGFVLHHWRSGRRGAVRMGFRHSAYCLGCCWLFMLVLFVAGAMSLVWMGVLSLAIFAEKVGTRPGVTSRVIGLLLFLLGGIVAVQSLASL